jgi:hypothetical protein
MLANPQGLRHGQGESTYGFNASTTGRRSPASLMMVACLSNGHRAAARIKGKLAL